MKINEPLPSFGLPLSVGELLRQVPQSLSSFEELGKRLLLNPTRTLSARADIWSSCIPFKIPHQLLPLSWLQDFVHDFSVWQVVCHMWQVANMQPIQDLNICWDDFAFTAMRKSAGMLLQPGLWETRDGLLFVRSLHCLCDPMNLMKELSWETARRLGLIPPRPWGVFFSLTLLAHDFQHSSVQSHCVAYCFVCLDTTHTGWKVSGCRNPASSCGQMTQAQSLSLNSW